MTDLDDLDSYHGEVFIDIKRRMEEMMGRKISVSSTFPPTCQVTL